MKLIQKLADWYKTRKIAKAIMNGAALATAGTAADIALETFITGPKVVQAEEQDRLNVGARADLLSRYNFRGYTYSDGYVIQLIPSASYRGFSLVGFINYDGATGQINETDITADFTMQISKFLLSAGYTFLSFPNTEALDVHEIYVGVSLDTFLKPRIMVFHDFDHVEGQYIEGTAEHNFKINEHELLIKALLAYNNHFLREESGLSHAQLIVSLPVPLTDRITITPNMTYSHALETTNFENMFFFGVNVEGGF